MTGNIQGDTDTIAHAAGASIIGDLESEITIHEAFDSIARRNPERTAIIDAGGSHSYEDLRQCMDELSKRMERYDFAPEDAIAVWGGRSTEFVIAALATMRAGCAYVPLDIKSPEARLRDVISVSGAELMIVAGEDCENKYALFGQAEDQIAIETSTRSLNFTFVRLDTNPAPKTAQSIKTSPLAFIMFTSGSAGKSKGVLIEHGPVLSLINGIDEYVDLSPGRTVLNFSRTSFDATTFEIWGTLLRGARLAIYPEVDLDLGEFQDFLRRHDVDTAWLTAGLFHEIMCQDPTVIDPLQQLLVGGDVVSPTPFNAFLALRPGRRIINGYGPTEATTFTTTFAATSPVGPNSSVPIGRAIPGARTYVLTRELQPVEVGAAGELHVAGAGLARGYLGENRRNRDFLYGVCDGIEQRLYATGDFVRELPDGNLEYLGRDDEQIKIRGFRVELSEIERCLERLAGVERAVVVPRREQGAATELIAVVVDNGERVDFLNEMREHVRTHLPDYMVPARWFVTDRIPLNPNGKVDRILLAQGWGKEMIAQTGFSQTNTEEEILETWKISLQRSAIGPDDAFLDLGGNSLTAVRIVAKLKEQYGVQLSVRDFNSCGTVRRLAHLIDGLRSSTKEPLQSD